MLLGPANSGFWILGFCDDPVILHAAIKPETSVEQVCVQQGWVAAGLRAAEDQKQSTKINSDATARRRGALRPAPALGRALRAGAPAGRQPL